MGTPASGLAEVATALKQAGIKAGIPLPSLSSQLAIRDAPLHEKLWYWQAIRRFFDDFGLPPIAPVPEQRISPEAQEYYVSLFARTLGKLADAGFTLCVDELTIFALDLVAKAVNRLGARFEGWFLYRDPAQEVYDLRQKMGYPPQLSEYIWRNMTAHAALAVCNSITMVNMDILSQASWRDLLANISHHNDRAFFSSAPMPVMTPGFANISTLTKFLHDALNGTAKELNNAAQKVINRQIEQNGWQFVGCLDSGDLAEHAKRLLALTNSRQEEPATGELASHGNAAELVDYLERQLMEERNNYEARLFLSQQSMAVWYQDRLKDEKLLFDLRIKENAQKHLKASKRRKIRLRKMLERAQKQ